MHRAGVVAGVDAGGVAMSKRSRAPRVPAAPLPRPSSPRHSRRRRQAWFAIFLLVAAVVFGRVFLVGRGPAYGTVAFPAPREAAPSATVTQADFVGAAQCARCHQAEYAIWTRSTHGRAGGRPSRDVVLAAFDGSPIRFRDAIVTPRVLEGNHYVFVIEQEGSAPRTITVDGTIGAGHMAGGGTQGFMSRWGDGTWRFVPFDYSRQAGTWFCNTNSRADHGWRPITADMSLAACGDWPPTRVLGDVPRFANCQGCHGSQVESRFDSTTHRYKTSFASLAIDCESCHGPGRRHVELAASPAMAHTADIGMRALATLDKEQSLRVCYQCHALKDQLQQGYLSGDSLERYYSLALPLLGDRALGPDGRVRTFAYQENQRYSECYRKGGMRCTDCHDPHAQSYRDVNGASLPGRLDDRQCTSCHASLAENAETHTRHRPASPGSRCVSCHMPYLQHPEVGSAIRFARADHTIPLPRPLADSAAGVSSACASCHVGVPPSVLQRQIERWTGRPPKPLSPSVAAQVALGDRPLTSASARALIIDDGHRMATVAGLARLVDALAMGSTGWFDDPAATRLRELSRDTDADIAALALAALHLERGGDRETRQFLAKALESVGAHDGALRDRWALVLGYVADRHAGNGEHDAALDAYRKALEITPENPRLVLNLANAERDGARNATEIAHALADYAHALRLDPASALVLVNQGIAQATAGDTTGAMASWQHAMRVEPGEPLAPFNLGNVLLLQGRLAEAATAYRVAIALDPGLAPAHFNLARALASTGSYEPALRAIRDGLRFDSANVDAHAMAAMLSQREAGRARARRAAP